jgi:hypothetical protein
VSNTLAIGAVTATLRQLLSRVAEPLPLDPIVDGDLADATCTARPPDKARMAEDANQINIFLYQTAPNAALRNAGMPGTSSGDNSLSPLALNLYYLITAYGRDHDDILSHRLLGRAMTLLHDRSTLRPADIESALPGADLARQFEQVRITPQPLNTEEMSKLWSTFQTPYRISTAYEARVVLMESNRQSKAGPPVIWRGPTNRGNAVVTGIVPAVAGLTDITLPTPGQPSARPGDLVTFVGHDLAGVEIDAVFAHRLTSILVKPPVITGANINGFALTMPAASASWPAGLYAVGGQVVPAIGATRTTNVLPLTLAPRIVAVTPASPVTLDADGAASITVTISPPVWSAQRVSLIVGDLEYGSRALPASPATTATVAFDVRGRGPGTYPLRVRVDGVDSFIVRYEADPITMDPDPVLHLTLVS